MAAATVLATVVWNGCACTGHVPFYCPNPCPAQNPSLPHASVHPSSNHFHTKNSPHLLVCPCERWRQCLSQAHMSSVKWGCLHTVNLPPFMILANMCPPFFQPLSQDFPLLGMKAVFVCHKQTCHPSIRPAQNPSAQHLSIYHSAPFHMTFNPLEG